MDADLLKILAPYGLGGILAAILGWVMYRVGLRMIAAIDRISGRVEETRDIVIGFDAKLDAIREVTPPPIETGRVRVKTDPHGHPIGYYGPRKGTRDDG